MIFLLSVVQSAVQPADSVPPATDGQTNPGLLALVKSAHSPGRSISTFRRVVLERFVTVSVYTSCVLSLTNVGVMLASATRSLMATLGLLPSSVKGPAGPLASTVHSCSLVTPLFVVATTGIPALCR